MAVERKALVRSGPSIGSRIGSFFQDSWHELQKVSWPSKAEVKNFTIVVLVAVTFVGLCLYVLDAIVGTLFARILGQ